MKPTNTLFAVCTSIVIALSGCATAHRLYAPPSGDDVAYLRVTDPANVGFPASTMIATFEKAENCKGRFFLQGVASGLRQTEVSLGFAKIQAGRPFTLAIHRPLGYGSLCVPIFSFVPVTGRYYHARLSTEGNSCSVSLGSYASRSGGEYRSEAVKRLMYTNAWDENGSFCMTPW
jgi:hypothetical protein